MRTQFCIFLFVQIVACSQNQDSSGNFWESNYRDLSFTYRPPWTAVQVSDNKSETFMGLLDQSDGKSYIIKMGKDVSKDSLSDELYFTNAKDLMLNENPGNFIVFENDTSFHSHPAHQIKLYMLTKKWGPVNQLCIINRNGKEFFSIQITYPVSGVNKISEPPKSLFELDKSIFINGK